MRRRTRSGGYFLDRKPADKSELIEYDFDTSDVLRVPGDWNSQNERLYYYEGTVWYRRKFDYAIAPGRRVFVHFGAANYQADVYLNGRKLGRHVGGFTPFEFEITGKLRARDNSLVVKVDNTRHADAVPTVNTDWWNYGGLTRDVTIVETPATFIRDYRLQLATGSTERIAASVQLDGNRRTSPRDALHSRSAYSRAGNERCAGRRNVRCPGARVAALVAGESQALHGHAVDRW